MHILNKKELQACRIRNNGFSLVELSVSIVIIALLFSAIMKGQNLINEAKLQAIVSEVSSNKMAITSFYNKYDQYPGDFNEAVANWGASTSDGDNNGHIEFKNTAGTPVYEGYRAWQHLSYAGMVTSPYLGTTTTGAAVVVSDVPAAKSGGGYLLDYSQYGLTGKNVIVLGTPVATSASPVLASGVLTPSQAMTIDTKMDDGIPTTGIVRGADGNGATAGNCISTIYKLTLIGKDCIMIFKATD